MNRPMLVSVGERDRAQAEVTYSALFTPGQDLSAAKEAHVKQVLATALAVARAEGAKAVMQQRTDHVPPADLPTSKLLERVATMAAAWVEDLAVYIEDKGGKAYVPMVRASGLELGKRIRGFA